MHFWIVHVAATGLVAVVSIKAVSAIFQADNKEIRETITVHAVGHLAVKVSILKNLVFTNPEKIAGNRR